MVIQFASEFCIMPAFIYILTQRVPSQIGISHTCILFKAFYIIKKCKW